MSVSRRLLIPLAAILIALVCGCLTEKVAEDASGAKEVVNDITVRG